jgi:hypothetical protein
MDISDIRARFEASVARTKAILELHDQQHPAPAPDVVVEQPAPLLPLVVPVLVEAQGAFIQALLKTKSIKDYRPDWWLQVAMRKCGYQCAYCGCSLTADDRLRHNHAGQPTVDHLIPLTVGGPHHHEAVVASCLACNTSKGMRDWIRWGKATDPKAIKALRAKLSRECWNHLAPDPETTRTKLKIERMLEARWKHPRFRAHASITTGGAFIGVKDIHNAVPIFPWMQRHHGGHLVDGLKKQAGQVLSVFAFEDQRAALDAIWELIAHNALVRRLDLSPAFPDATPSDNEAWADWAETFPNIGNLVKRRWNKPSGFRGHSQAWREGRVIKSANGNWVVHDPVRKT